MKRTKGKILLGVNIDHVATIREARKDIWPKILEAAQLAIQGGADQITIHLREDRRHIQDKDVYCLKKNIKKPLNLEMAVVDEITKIACRVKPHQVTLVPEKRQEITTEGGLDVVRNFNKVKKCVEQLQKAGIQLSLFIDPDIVQTKASKESGATHVEFHTGSYAHNPNPVELNKLKKACKYAQELGLVTNAGHGLTYQNVKPIADIKGMNELNIGHNIVARALMVGMQKAVQEMKKAI
ncbi:pyridoxine 5'-phosphate synthase [Candidatus Margulisiibacteriota bacterium]